MGPGPSLGQPPLVPVPAAVSSNQAVWAIAADRDVPGVSSMGTCEMAQFILNREGLMYPRMISNPLHR